ncbi:unnamed protein product [Allacma fusca]|uniref:Uncharacterized protein n=1 Tax=Allacma fusca TaxID=39272 RepID=A0A8J2LHQ2_9HEXA|nr:unnamed protein product [Allacma fusca]
MGGGTAGVGESSVVGGGKDVTAGGSVGRKVDGVRVVGDSGMRALECGVGVDWQSCHGTRPQPTAAMASSTQN